MRDSCRNCLRIDVVRFCVVTLVSRVDSRRGVRVILPLVEDLENLIDLIKHKGALSSKVEKIAKYLHISATGRVRGVIERAHLRLRVHVHFLVEYLQFTGW